MSGAVTGRCLVIGSRFMGAKLAALMLAGLAWPGLAWPGLAAAAAPAHADTTDAQFIAFLDGQSIPYDTTHQAVTEAKAGCLVLRQGNSFVSAVQGLTGVQTDYSEDTAATFLGGAIGAYCPDQISKEAHAAN
jgi:phage baseplate assembly protein gpV